jgi:hypothetical protein
LNPREVQLSLAGQALSPIYTPTLTTIHEKSGLGAAKKRIGELENEVAILKRARELLREPHDPKGDTRP